MAATTGSTKTPSLKKECMTFLFRVKLETDGER
jgi:hypothetical protein